MQKKELLRLLTNLKKIVNTAFTRKTIELVFLVPLSAILLISSFVFPAMHDIIRYLSYIMSAYTLAALCCKAPVAVQSLKQISIVNRCITRYRSDTRLRVMISLYGSFTYNAAYAVFQLVLGFWHSSVWFYAMSAYYIMLAVMRFRLLTYTRKNIPGRDREAELRHYRLCGIILAMMNLALSVIVFYIAWQNRTFRHHEITMISMAAYTFTTFTLAVINIVKYRKYRSPVYSAAKILSFTSAMVSMLTLETAMLTVFGQSGGNSDPFFHRLMTGVTGAAVLITVLVMSLYMIVKGTQELRKIS